MCVLFFTAWRLMWRWQFYWSFLIWCFFLSPRNRDWPWLSVVFEDHRFVWWMRDLISVLLQFPFSFILPVFLATPMWWRLLSASRNSIQLNKQLLHLSGEGGIGWNNELPLRWWKGWPALTDGLQNVVINRCLWFSQSPHFTFPPSIKLRW